MKALKKRPVHMKRPHFPNHQNLAKGGVVKMAAGGALAPTAVSAGAIQAPPANTLAPAPSGVNTTAATGAGGQGITGNISNLVGTNNNFQGQAANLTPGTNTAQLNTAYGGAQNALNAQTGVANALAPQAGTAVNSQNTLTNELTAMSQGQGPNPAQAELNQATGQNVAAQAALMAGQRGSSANVGQIARGAAQQGAATQQQAVGQGATLEAQQQIAAQQNLANLANNQATQAGNATSAASTAQQNEQNILQNANTSLNNADVGMQSNINNVNSQAAIANQQSNSNVLAGLGNMASNIPIVGSIFAKGGQVPMASGGIAPSPLTGAPPAQDAWMAPVFAQSSPSSGPSIPGTPPAPQEDLTPFGGNSDKSKATSGVAAGQGMGTVMAGGAGDAAPAAGGLGDLAVLAAARGGRICTGPHRGHVANFLAGGGQVGDVKAIVSPKEVYLAPEQVHKVLHEGADPMKIGHKFPGTDKVKGRDSRKNDVIPTTLRAGGVVIPVHITTHKDASNKARKFVGRTMAKHMKRPAGA